MITKMSSGWLAMWASVGKSWIPLNNKAIRKPTFVVVILLEFTRACQTTNNKILVIQKNWVLVFWMTSTLYFYFLPTSRVLICISFEKPLFCLWINEPIFSFISKTSRPIYVHFSVFCHIETSYKKLVSILLCEIT